MKEAVSSLEQEQIACRNERNRNEVRWYLMSYPQSSKGLTEGLKREIARRSRYDEVQIEYFAPTFTEVQEIKGKLVNTKKLLLFNYFFVKASEREIFRMKQFETQYNFFKRCFKPNGESYFPFVSEETISTLRLIASAYLGTLPIYTANAPWLLKGDRIKIVRGQFKGLEATLFENQHSGNSEIMVSLDDMSWVPLLRVRTGDYELLELYNRNAAAYEELSNDSQTTSVYKALLSYLKEGQASTDLANTIIKQYEGIAPNTDIQRCKMFALLLSAYKITGDEAHLKELTSTVIQILPAVKAEFAKALLTVSLYACTNSEIYYDKAHKLLAPWRNASKIKRNKQVLINRLDELDSVLR